MEENICGRPLGMAFDTLSIDNLIVADAYYGIWEFNLTSEKKTNLVSPTDVLPGDIPRPAKLFNSLTVAKNGDIFWTESTSDFNLNQNLVTLFVGASGRLFRYSRKEKKNYVLMDRLWFANGVALSPDESFVIVSETYGSRIQKVHLKGPKKGQSEIFIEGLPGFPDNLSADEDGIWAPLVVSADADHPVIAHTVASLPLLRKFVVRMAWIVETPLKMIQEYFPNFVTEKLLYEFGSTSSLTFL